MRNFIIAQLFGILGMAVNIVSYQAKERRNIIFFQLFGSVLFSVNMFMIGAKTGFLLNLIGILRGAVYSKKDRFTNIRALTAIFIFLYLISYPASFVIFAKEPCPVNLISETLPIIAMIATTIGFSGNDSKSIRLATFISSPLWFTYNCINLSVGGIICEALGMLSVLTAFIRLDLRRDKVK